MARTDERFREAYNALLEQCGKLEPEAELPSESALADQLDVSRTVVRAALKKLDAEGIVSWGGRTKRLLRKPGRADRLPVENGTVSPEELERLFLEWILRFDVAPGTPLNVSDLARKLHVTAHALQAFLASLSRFGLVRRRIKGGWELLGFTAEYAVELSDFRAILELNAVSHLAGLPDDHTIWSRLTALAAEHEALAADIDNRFHDFSLLDERFHLTLGSVIQNRFVAEFQKVISLVFHYHYQWDKTFERQRNAAAIQEHLRVIRALQARDRTEAMEAARDHLRTSKQTLLSSLTSHRLA